MKGDRKMKIIEKENGKFEIEVIGVVVGEGNMELAETEQDFAYLERIDIAEEHRGQGHGTKALNALKETYGTYYFTPDNEDAARLYERVAGKISDTEYDKWGFAVDNGWGVYEI